MTGDPIPLPEFEEYLVWFSVDNAILPTHLGIPTSVSSLLAMLPFSGHHILFPCVWKKRWSSSPCPWKKRWSWGICHLPYLLSILAGCLHVFWLKYRPTIQVAPQTPQLKSSIMSFTSTHLKDLAVGNIIYTDVMINKADMADPTATSTTAKKFASTHQLTSPAYSEIHFLG